MARLKDIKENPSIILFGLPFTGKSTLAVKLAAKYKLIYVDMENGLVKVARKFPEYIDNIEAILLPDTPSYPIAIETCLKMVKGPVDICDKHGKVNCMLCKRNEEPFTAFDPKNVPDDTIVIFDSGTQLMSSAINSITRKQPDDYKLEWDDWGSLGHLMSKFYGYIQNASYKRIIITHVTEAEQEDGKNLLFPVAGTRNFSANVGKNFDHMIYLEKKNNKHMAASSTTYMTKIATGSRSDIAIENFREPDLLPFFDDEALKEAVAGRKDSSTKDMLKNLRK